MYANTHGSLPARLDDATPRKRISLRYHLPSDDNYAALLPLFSYYLRLTDQLVQAAHFRPEVLRKIRTAREDTIKQI